MLRKPRLRHTAKHCVLYKPCKSKVIKRIGICCSGNTCRSPITAIWLEKFHRDLYPNSNLTIWTAGIVVTKDKVNSPMEDDPLEVAKEMKLDMDLYEKLSKHKSQSVWTMNKQADLIVWISAPNKILQKDSPFNVTRLQRMKELATKLESTLFIIPEKDDAWEAKNTKAPIDEVKQKYYEQAERLIEWSKMLNTMIMK